MARCRDGKHPFESEVPFPVRIEERQDESSGSSIDMDRDIIAGPGIVFIQSLVKSLYIIIHSGPCDAGYRNYADGVFVAHLYRLLHVEGRIFPGDRNRTHLYLPELAEFLPHHLIGGTHHEIRLVERLSCSLSAFAPSEPRGHSAQHAGL